MRKIARLFLIEHCYNERNTEGASHQTDRQIRLNGLIPTTDTSCLIRCDALAQGKPMSIQLIQKYYAEVDRIVRYGGSRNESSLRKPFQDLLEGYARGKGQVLGGVAHFTPRLITHLRGLFSRSVRCNGSASKMIPEEIFQRHALRNRVLSHRDSRCTCEIVLGHSLPSAGIEDFVVSADEEGDLAVDDGFYALSIAIYIWNHLKRSSTPFFFSSSFIAVVFRANILVIE